MPVNTKSSTQSGGFSSDIPVKKAKAKVQEVTAEERTGQFVNPGDMNIVLKLAEIQVLETDTSYPYKTGEIRVKDSEQTNSKKGVLEDSIKECLGLETLPDQTPINLIEGKTVVFERDDNHLFFTRRDGEENRGLVWRVTDVEGQSAVSSIDAALQELDGKTKQDFTVAALSNPNVSRDSALQSSIIDDSFFKRPEVANGFEVDSAGVYRRK